MKFHVEQGSFEGIDGVVARLKEQRDKLKEVTVRVFIVTRNLNGPIPLQYWDEPAAVSREDRASLADSPVAGAAGYYSEDVKGDSFKNLLSNLETTMSGYKVVFLTEFRRQPVFVCYPVGEFEGIIPLSDPLE